MNTMVDKLSSTTGRDRRRNREFDEVPANISYPHVVSNEANLFKAIPYIQRCRGVGLGVGFDQMLEFAANSPLDKVVIIDQSLLTSTATRVLLEAARYHKDIYNEYPTTAQLMQYFSPGMWVRH